MSKVLETRLEIDLNALESNFRLLKSYLSPKTKIMGVVKASAYGTDSIITGKHLVKIGAQNLAVAYIEEGVKLRKAGIEVPILVFYPQLEEIQNLIDYQLTPSVYTHRFMEGLIQELSHHDIDSVGIHLKINTGLNRLGFELSELDSVLKHLNSEKKIKVAGVFSHLAASGSKDEIEFTKSQIAKFEEARSFFKNHLGYDFESHICNSSGILNYPEAEFDLVRAGIALYGYGNNPTEHKMLKAVASLKTVIAQLRTIQKGDSVGYERKFKAEKTTKIATLPLGYADGISRIFGNGKARVLVNGKKAPIIGNVCMDTLMVDVTGIDCEEGDEVEVFGKNNTVIDFDIEQQTIPYEIITRISQRVTRVLV
ncbi:alanine racemase [Psychroflexus sp. CAK57W]|uniref:alanine racemase n=1 Tax=Psychroflexus curvus TaxID=2873595 RepID=UPI001CCD1DE5|nr:alanine racemase [Psychroflexus curvus]MBZ9627106.1 alanine racemase [Psychroflexus curvus]MBZ9787112.1 alanine racemase [Psychroflexus curvus]